MKILISCPRGRTFQTFFNKENIDYINSLGEVIWNESARNFSHSELSRLISDCDIYIMAWGAPMLDSRLLHSAKRLSVIIYLGASVIFQIPEALYSTKIMLIGAEDFYVSSAAEGTLSYIFAALRRIPEYSLRIKYQSDWRHSWDRCASLMGKTVGILNYNSSALRLADMLCAFDVKVLMYDQMGIPADKIRGGNINVTTENELFSLSDIVCIHTPRHGNGYHSVDLAQLVKMKENAILIDTSIGGIVNIDALALMIIRKNLFAVIDVCEYEMSELCKEYHFLDNLILMPHMAGATEDIRPYIAKTLVGEAVDFIKKSIIPNHTVVPQQKNAKIEERS